jgi:hypothetical protein
MIMSFSRGNIWNAFISHYVLSLLLHIAAVKANTVLLQRACALFRQRKFESHTKHPPIIGFRNTLKNVHFEVQILFYIITFRNKQIHKILLISQQYYNTQDTTCFDHYYSIIRGAQNCTEQLFNIFCMQTEMPQALKCVIYIYIMDWVVDRK